MNKISLKLYGAVSMVAAFVLAFAGVAGASAPDPEAEVTSYLSGAVADIFPIIVAVAGGSVALLVLVIGIRMAVRAVSSRGRSVA